MKFWVAYTFLGIFVLIVLAAIIGTAYEMLGRRRAAREFPPRGKLVDIGGRRIHLDCRGTGSPTVVFEAGLDIMGSLSWSKVHDEIAKTTRACAYSRAGIMWSDPYDAPQNGKSIADDLHAALNKAGEHGPFVLVGHSMGGPYIMTYTKYFGADVAGMVFVDASHPEQIQRFNAISIFAKSKLMRLKEKIAVTLQWTGVVRAVSATYKRMANQPEFADLAMKAYASTSLGSLYKESQAVSQTLAEAGTFRQLGQRPLIVLTAVVPISEQALTDLKLTADQAKQYQEVLKQMHEDQATWSSQSQHQLVFDTGHYIQFDQPDVVIAAVRSVVEKVRAKS